MMLMAAALFTMLMMVLMAATFFTMFVMMLMMTVETFHLKTCQFTGERCLALHGIDHLLTGQFFPGRGNDGSNLIQLTDQFHSFIQLGRSDTAGTGKDDGGSGLDLVVVELAEILAVYLDLVGVRHSHSIAERHFCIGDLVDSGDHIRQLTNTGGFDDDPVGMIFSNHLLQSLAEIAHKAAADTAGVHFGNVDAGFLQETAIDADLTELIFNEHQFLALIALSDHLFDERSLTGAKEAGINIDFSHSMHLLYKIFQFIIAPNLHLGKPIFPLSTEFPWFLTTARVS